MQFNNETIREACFELVSELMWEKDRLDTERLGDFMDELSEMTDVFTNEAIGLLDLLGDDPLKEEIMTRAIWYLHDIHALPPLRGNIEWFKHGIMVLVEIVRPQSGVRKSNGVFLDWMAAGILQTGRSKDERF
ncbi:MAG: hypothetical protein V4539_17200 [Bacteroidota bacterium]